MSQYSNKFLCKYWIFCMLAAMQIVNSVSNDNCEKLKCNFPFGWRRFFWVCCGLSAISTGPKDGQCHHFIFIGVYSSIDSTFCSDSSKKMANHLKCDRFLFALWAIFAVRLLCIDSMPCLLFTSIFLALF